MKCVYCDRILGEAEQAKPELLTQYSTHSHVNCIGTDYVTSWPANLIRMTRLAYAMMAAESQKFTGCPVAIRKALMHQECLATEAERNASLGF